MTPIRREMMFKIADGNVQIFPRLYHLDRLTRCDDVLAFLLRENITGRRFLDCLREEHGGSVLELAKWAIKKINRDAETRPIIGGRDFILT